MGLFVDKNLDFQIAQMQIMNTNFLAQCKQYCKRAFDEAWFKVENNQKVQKSVSEAQAWFNKIGNQSVLAFAAHGKLQELIYMNDNTWAPLVPPHVYTLNQDGTVTISAQV